MSVGEGRAGPGTASAVNVKVSIPELDNFPPFWLRSYATYQTFAELYQTCANSPEVRQSGAALERVPASRHFWCADRMMRRDQTLHLLVSHLDTSSGALPEISLTLRRDLYQIGPRKYLAGDIEYTYVDAEDKIARVVPQILTREKKTVCFDLFDSRRRRLAWDRSLADYEIWPAWENADAFPERARLLLKPRTGWMAYAVLLVGAVAGLLIGYRVMTMIGLGH